MPVGKRFVFGEEAREKLYAGVERVAKEMRKTLGTSDLDREIAIDYFDRKREGISVSFNEIERVGDQYVDMGIAIAHQLAKEVKETYGDGSARSVLILHALLESAYRFCASGVSVVEITQGMEYAHRCVLKELQSSVIPFKEMDRMKQISIAGAGGNEVIGAFVMEVFRKMGRDGVIAIQPSRKKEIIVKMTQGKRFQHGYVSSYFCTDFKRRCVQLNQARIAVFNQKVELVQQILPLLQVSLGQNWELLIVVPEIAIEVVSTLAMNKLEGILKVCVVSFEGEENGLEELANLTGAIPICLEGQLETGFVEALGEAEEIFVAEKEMILVGMKGKAKQGAEKTSQKRGRPNAAIIQVGALSDCEAEGKSKMIRGGLNAIQLALKEGVVIGGGVALLKASRSLCKLKLKGEKWIGSQIFIHACEAPFRQIMNNLGYNTGSITDESSSTGIEYGFNTDTRQADDLGPSGLLDLLTVTKGSLEIAYKAAKEILLSEVLIGEEGLV